MFFPLILLLTGCCSAAWLAYGINPDVAAEFGGLALITFTRRVQWILLIFTILPCLVLIVYVAIGKARAWWLVGLSIVVALLFVRFDPGNKRPVRVLEADSMPTAAEANLGLDEEFVVGLEHDGVAFALPYRSLYRTPIVQLTDFDKRLIVIFSPYANSATVLEVTREVKATDLEYVAAPDNSTLVYNRKYGQFIVGITGKTDQDEEPTGVRDRLTTERLPLRLWRARHPQTRLMVPTESDMSAFGVPLMPQYPIHLADSSLPPETPIVLVRSNPPVALLAGGDFSKPAHAKIGDAPIVLWRENGALRAFFRTVDGDLYLTFTVQQPKEKGSRPRLVDNQTASTWTTAGLCTDGDLKGRRLTPVPVEEDVYWGVSKTWWPQLQLIRVE